MIYPVICLAKHDSTLLCQCTCDSALAAFPRRDDRPWKGSGWQFFCSECNKPFTFARAVDMGIPEEDIPNHDLLVWGVDPVSGCDISDVMEVPEGMSDLEVGKLYVWLDGRVIPANAPEISFEGWYARHHFDLLPHIKALIDPATLKDVLRSKRYWTNNAVDRSE